MKALFLTSYGGEGYGHIFRCMAISSALNEFKIKNKFLVSSKDKKKILSKEKLLNNFNWYKSKKKTFNIINKYELVIVDSIIIKKKYLEELKNKCKYLVYINDYHRWKINNILHIDWTLFSKKQVNKTEINGHTYTPLRKEFWTNDKVKIRKKIKKIFIFFGGADIHNLSYKICKIINSFKKNYLVTVISKNKFNFKNTKCVKYMNAKSIKKNILNSDLVITSGGQTLYELANLGAPALVVSETKYDLEDVNAWQKQKSIIYLGKWNAKNFTKTFIKKFEAIEPHLIRNRLSKNGKKIIDGKGALRLVKEILKYATNNSKK
ncbi:hypothetical protein N8717_04765 [Candidatus Pelagibacter sp.]|jgi:UDP-2,4-diacetamido-2,4,6-trideoxy-beta-L-altropyranose hydrolase|nr:hypothetical protein [Candidatus Pelagibacter sp.]